MVLGHTFGGVMQIVFAIFAMVSHVYGFIKKCVTNQSVSNSKGHKLLARKATRSKCFPRKSVQSDFHHYEHIYKAENITSKKLKFYTEIPESILNDGSYFEAANINSKAKKYSLVASTTPIVIYNGPNMNYIPSFAADVGVLQSSQEQSAASTLKKEKRQASVTKLNPYHVINAVNINY